VAGRSRTR